MSWYNASWGNRCPILIDKKTIGVAAVDVTAAIPIDFDDFWNNVLASGNDIRVTDADGITLETYDIAAGFNTATRSGTIEIQAIVPPAASSMFVAWLYWGNSGASDARTAFAPAAARTGYIHPSGPGFPRFRAGVEEPGAQKPRQLMAYGTVETVFPWFDLSGLLFDRADTYSGRRLADEISYLQLFCYNSAGTDQTAERTITQLRLWDRAWVRAHITSGTDDADRALSVRVGTSGNRVADVRILAQCRDVLP